MAKKISALVITMLVCLSACQSLGQKAEAGHSQDELKREYKASKDDFRKKYDGKEVVVYGKADTINPSGDQVYLRLETTDSGLYGIPDVICSVDKPDADRFASQKVGKGDYVRVKGTMSVDEKDLYEIQLKSCKLVKTGIDAMSD